MSGLVISVFIQELNIMIPLLQEENGGRQVLYHSETWDLMARRWGKLEKDFLPKTGIFDISKIPDIYDCIKYDVQHNRGILDPGPAWNTALQLYTYVKNLADVVIPQVQAQQTRVYKVSCNLIFFPILICLKLDFLPEISFPLSFLHLLFFPTASIY